MIIIIIINNNNNNPKSQIFYYNNNNNNKTQLLLLILLLLVYSGGVSIRLVLAFLRKGRFRHFAPSREGPRPRGPFSLLPTFFSCTRGFFEAVLVISLQNCFCSGKVLLDEPLRPSCFRARHRDGRGQAPHPGLEPIEE